MNDIQIICITSIIIAYLVYLSIKQKANTKKEFVKRITDTIQYIARKVIDKK